MSTRMPGSRVDAVFPVPGLWRAIAGFIVWAVAFVVLYVGHATGCLYVPSDLPPASLRLVLVTLWLVHLLLMAILVWRSSTRLRGMRSRQRTEAHACFMWRVTFLIDMFALGAVFVTGLPVLMIAVCSP